MDIKGNSYKELLYRLIDIGLDDMDNNNVRPFEDALADIEIYLDKEIKERDKKDSVN